MPRGACCCAACAEELDAELAPLSLKSPKSRLQELAYARHGRPPAYRVVTVDGPDHARRYVVEVSFQGEVLGEGSGRSRRDAETEAAAIALRRLEGVEARAGRCRSGPVGHRRCPAHRPGSPAEPASPSRRRRDGPRDDRPAVALNPGRLRSLRLVGFKSFAETHRGRVRRRHQRRRRPERQRQEQPRGRAALGARRAGPDPAHARAPRTSSTPARRRAGRRACPT